MKTKLIKKEGKKFKPFTVEFTCETIEDATMWFDIANEGTILKGIMSVGTTDRLRRKSIIMNNVNKILYKQLEQEITSQGFEI